MDTGSTAILISQLYYEAYVNELFARAPGVEWYYKKSNLYTSCDADMPQLFFMVDNHWLEVSPKDYMFQTDPVENECILFLLPTTLPYNVLGMPIFVDYYSVHEPEPGRISWAPHVTSIKQEVKRANAPSLEKFIPISAKEN